MMQEETALSQAERAKAADISEKINLSDSGGGAAVRSGPAEKNCRILRFRPGQCAHKGSGGNGRYDLGFGGGAEGIFRQREGGGGIFRTL